MRSDTIRYGIRQIWKEKINSAERNWEEIRINNGSNEKKIHNQERNIDENNVEKLPKIISTKKGKKNKVEPIKVIEEEEAKESVQKVDDNQQKPVITLSYSFFNPNKNNENNISNDEPEIRLSYMRTVKKANAFSYVPSSNKDNSTKSAIRITKFNKGFERDLY